MKSSVATVFRPENDFCFDKDILSNMWQTIKFILTFIYDHMNWLLLIFKLIHQHFVFKFYVILRYKDTF